MRQPHFLRYYTLRIVFRYIRKFRVRISIIIHERIVSARKYPRRQSDKRRMREGSLFI